MKSLRALLVTAVVTAALVSPSSAADVRDAVVRIPSHGGSGTVIETGPGRTVILSAAHVFRDTRTGALSQQPIKIDVPEPIEGGFLPHKAKMSLPKVTTFAGTDLALIIVEDGPWPHKCPVAPAGHKPSKNLLSVGYAKMQTPAREVRSTITYGIMANDRTFTIEPPTPGMSGGALIDMESGVLVGVTSAINAFGQGVYVRHSDILAFLGNDARPAPGGGVSPKGYIRIEEDRSGQPTQPPTQQLIPGQPRLEFGGPFSGPYCPDGQCPNVPRNSPTKPLGYLDYPDGSGRKLKLMNPIPRGE